MQDLVDEGVLAPPIDGNHGEIHPKTADFVSAGIPFIMASDLVAGQVDLKGCSFISPEQARTLRKGFSKQGDVLLSHKATIGRTAIVGELDSEFIVLTPQVTYYRVQDPKTLDRRFLRYYFDSPEFQQVLAMWAGAGSTRAYLGITAQRKLPVALPPIEQQIVISEVLQPIDDRVNLLRQTNITLESIARAMFKSWFVDFDPVRAKAEGREPTRLDAETAALFPDALEDSARGKIPKGWRIGTLGDVAWNPRSQAKPGQIPVNTPYIGLEHMPRKSIALDKMGTAEGLESGKFWFEFRDILFGKLRPYFHKVGVAPCNGVCSTDILVIRPREMSWLGYVAMHASSDELIAHTTRLSNGARMPRTSWHDVDEYVVVLPDIRCVKAFSDIVDPLFERILANMEAMVCLSDLRDALLPRLISGKLSLAEAHTRIEEVTV